MAVKLGEYILERRIGKGGMGQVFLARQESLDRLVAVKVLPKELAKDETFRARFEREAKSAASLIHPNVIQIYSFGIEKGVPYFAMEYVDGEDLSFKLKQGEHFDIKEGVRIVRDVAKALECAHRKGMVHRDIKPSNIMIASDEAVKVMDFGLAKAARVRTSITQTGLIMGTPPYMSPEQGKGDELDIRSDMYSLGIVFYELLTGVLPFQADTPTAVIYQHIYETPKPIRELNPSVPESLQAIAMKLIEKKPDKRYLDPTALLADLDAYDVGAQVTAAVPGATPPQPFPRTLEIDTSPSPDTAVVSATPASGTIAPGVSKALLAGIAGGLAVAVVVIILLLDAWSDRQPTVIVRPGDNGPEKPTPGGTGTAGTGQQEGVLQLSALRAAVPDVVRNVSVRRTEEAAERARTCPFQDLSVPVGMYTLTLKRPGYIPCDINVEVTETGNVPRLDVVPVEFEVKPEVENAYAQGKSLVEQENYSQALVELRRVENEIPGYKNTDSLIALCNKHLQQTKELDDIFRLGMQHFRDGEWAKAVETLQKLPADYIRASEAFGLLAEARDKLASEQQIGNLLRESQEALIAGDLPRAETSANSAVAVGGASEITNTVLTGVARARELIKAAETAESKQEYGDAIAALEELLQLMPQCQKETQHLARVKELHQKQLEHRAKVAALLQEARFAVKADDLDTAIRKLGELLQNLDPDNQDAKIELARARALRTRKNIAARLAQFDDHFLAGRAKEIAKLIDPERLRLRSQIADEMDSFLKESVRIVKAGHKDLNIEFDKDTASVNAVFFFEIELTEADRSVKGTLNRRITLVRRADIWYIAAIENLD